MINVLLGIIARIISNSYLNVFQKTLTNRGERSSVINFYTYLGLTVLSIPLIRLSNITPELLQNFFIMGFLGALGNYFIIKALSIGELSTLAPINSYKPIVAMFIGFFCLKEIPSIYAIFAIGLIIAGNYIIYGLKHTNMNSRAVIYRVFALLLSASEAVFIKKLVLLTGISNTFFLWALSGLIFAFFFILISKHHLAVKFYKEQWYLIAAVAIMQYSTNYVFSKMNVSYALAIFQLSTLLSVFLGVNIFGERDLKRKLIGASVMLIGAIILQQLS